MMPVARPTLVGQGAAPMLPPRREPPPCRGWSRAVATVAVASLFVTLGHAQGLSQDCKATQIGCNTCRRDDMAPTNLVSRLPRFSRDGQPVESDLGAYRPVVRCAPADESTCSLELNPKAGLDASAAQEEMAKPQPGHADDQGSYLTYAESVMAFGILCAILALLLLLVGLLHFGFSCCCCCCHEWCIGCTDRCCAGRCCCCLRCCCGTKRKRRRCARCGMGTFIVLTVALCAASYLFGVRALPDAAATMAKSGDPLGELVFGLREPTARFMERTMSTSLTDALVNVNRTLTKDAGIPTMLTNLVTLRATINGLSNTSSMLSTVGGLEAAVNGLPPRETTAGNLSAFHNSTQTLKTLLPRQSAALTALEAQVPTLQNAGSQPRLTAVSAIGNAMESAGATDDAAPATNTLATTMPSHAAAASLESDINGMFDAACGDCGSDNGTASRNALLADLDAFEANLTTLNSTTLRDTRQRLIAFNSSVAAVVNASAVHRGSLLELNSSVAALPDLRRLASTFQKTEKAFDDFDPQALTPSLEAVDRSLSAARPGLTDMRQLVNEMDAALATIRPLTASLADRIRHINSSIVRLPESISGVFDVLDDTNATIAGVQDEITSSESQISSFNDTLDSLPDIGGFLLDLQELSGNISSYNSEVNTTEMVTGLNALAGAVDALQLSSFLAAADAVTAVAARAGALPSDALLRALDESASVVDSVASDASALASAIRDWQKGVCKDDATVLCTCDDEDACLSSGGEGTSADCSGVGGSDVCTMRFAAAASPGVCQHDMAGNSPTACTVDANCTTGPCALPAPERTAALGSASDLTSSLVGYEAPFEVAAAVRSVNASVSASPDDAVVMAQLQGLNAGANALPDLSGPTASTKDAAETTTSIQDTDSLVGDWNSLHGAIDISTLSGVRGELQSFNDTRAEVNGDTVESAQSQLETITQFMEEDLAGHLARLTEKHLASVFERGGVGAQLREVADVLDAITANLTDGSGTDMASLLSGVLDFTDRLDDPAAHAAGGTTYAAQVFGVSSLLNATAAPATGRVLSDGNGAAYPGDKLCLTGACVDNTRDYYAETNVEESSDGALPVPLSGLLFGLALFVWPLFLALWALAPMCCCKGCRRISRLCSSLHMLALAFFSSIVLLVAGMLLFPVTIMASDTCASMENVAYKALPNVWPDMCTRDLNGTLSGQTCTFEQAELTLEVDLPGIAGDVLGGCNIGARENRDSPYRSVWNSLRDSMDGQALRNLDTMLEGMEGKVFEPLGPLRRDLHWGAGNMSEDLQFLVDGVSLVLQCGSMNNAYLSVKDAFCCDTMTAVFYLTVPWLLLGLVGCCCGCGCAGFGRTLWHLPKEGEEKPFSLSVQPVAGEDPPLLMAAANGNTDQVDKIVRDGGGVNVQSPATGDTALILAAKRGHYKVAERLVKKHSADPNVFNNDGAGALLCAIVARHEKMVKVLLEVGADANAEPVLMLLPGTAIETMVTPLIAAAYTHQPYVAKLLISAGGGSIVDMPGGGDPDGFLEPGSTPLLVAASLGDHSMVKTLLNAGAGVNVPTERGSTPMHEAARGGHIKVAALLAQKNADMNATNHNGSTPLDLAEANRHIAVAKHLRSHGGQLGNVKGPPSQAGARTTPS